MPGERDGALPGVTCSLGIVAMSVAVGVAKRTGLPVGVTYACAALGPAWMPGSTGVDVPSAFSLDGTTFFLCRTFFGVADVDVAVGFGVELDRSCTIVSMCATNDLLKGEIVQDVSCVIGECVCVRRPGRAFSEIITLTTNRAAL